ncbi:hypothetical protein LINPERHAP1_LOCUS12455 [Linum perenne]
MEVLRVVSSRLFLSRDGGSLVADICSLLSSLPQLRLLAVPRQANMTVHYVARHALRSLPSRGEPHGLGVPLILCMHGYLRRSCGSYLRKKKYPNLHFILLI